MNNRQHALRNIVLKMNVSGTVEVLDEQRLYRGGYGFVKLQVYAPKTQNTEAPILTAFCTTIDELGREKISTHNYRLLYVDEYELGDDITYLLFERYLPKEFTEKVTQPNGLKITLNYYDTALTVDESGEVQHYDNGIPKRHATDLLVSSRYTTTVYPGGWNDESVELDINDAEAAQIVDNMVNISELQAAYQGVFNRSIQETKITYQISDSGTTPPTGEWSGTIPQGQGDFLWTKIEFVFRDETKTIAYSVAATGKKGEKGDTGDKGDRGEKGEKGEKGDSFYSFNIQNGDLIVKTNATNDPEAEYKIDLFGNMTLTLK